MPKITILTIGDELLIGQVIDTNSAFMARELNLHGMEIFRKLTIADTLPEIIDNLKQALGHSDIVLMTGGLGPTKDDVTKKALATYFGVEMAFSEVTWERIEYFFQRLGRSTTPAHREQCYMPENALLLTNKMGTAPGMWMEQDDKIVVSMPGVPYEMEYLLTHEVIPRLRKRHKIRPIAHRTILTIGEGESRLAAQIEDLEDQLPAHLSLAYLPSLGQVRLRLTGRAGDAEQLQTDLQTYGDAFLERLQGFVFGEGTTTIEAEVGRLLLEKNLTLATAESCTGGYVAHRITSISGASAYFQGSIVAYDNKVKENLLGVSPTTLNDHGAVSEQTVIEMVAGALKALNVDVALAISGIAGPGGGSPEKPVGTIWLAVGNHKKTETFLLHGTKDREKNIQYASSRALGLLWNFLKDPKI
ncbi:CinA family nicotinamide mononucleotide deamidase-related protein [Lewinella cohaerens]|uniref:CinA family nicotinamide mononucleotide deamidase-related protein n=1 Tax=Lewinella cohaerens TaxID=70995 RepID=UPI00037AE2B6|nr:CinA family nicotinamide mononucleotide deamidase-related protein [Lewinella cohaerens]